MNIVKLTANKKISSSTTNRSIDPQDDEMWIGESGVTVHITNDDAGMFNIKKCDFDITVGNQETTKCTKMGDINLKLKNSTGTTVTVTLSNVRYVPTFIGNLFSIPTAMSNGAEIRFFNNKMEVRKKINMFEFLPSNTDSYGSLFSINAKRKIINRELAYMARRQTRCIDDTNNQDRHKKVKFDEDVTTYMYNEENEKKRIKRIKIQKKKKIET